MRDIAIPAWARKRAQDFLDANDPRGPSYGHTRLAAWITSALAGYMALHEKPPIDIEPEMTDNWTPDERTVRFVAARFREDGAAIGWEVSGSAIAESIEDLLPKPDPAKALVEEYRRTFSSPIMASASMEDEEQFCRWLISTGRVKP